MADRQEEPATEAGRAVVEATQSDPFIPEDQKAALREAALRTVLAIEREVRVPAPLDVERRLDVETALRVMDKLIDIHGCRDPDMGVPCSFHAREHRLLADVVYEEPRLSNQPFTEPAQGDTE